MNPKIKTDRFSLVGIQYRVIPSVREALVPLLPIRVKLEREPNNEADPNAILVSINDKISHNGMKLGYLRRQVAETWASGMDEGRLVIVKAYLIELDPQSASGELLISFRADKKSLEIED